MKTRILIGAAVVVAAVPAVIGLWGNSSFSQELPVRVPASGQVLVLDPTPSPTPSSSDSPSPTPSPSIDGSGADDRAGDDNGGDVPRDQRVEPGDDRDVQGSTGSTGGADDSGHHSGSDDSGHHSGSDDSGSGSDDSGHHSSDDHGGSGHGSDD